MISETRKNKSTLTKISARLFSICSRPGEKNVFFFVLFFLLSARCPRLLPGCQREKKKKNTSVSVFVLVHVTWTPALQVESCRETETESIRCQNSTCLLDHVIRDRWAGTCFTWRTGLCRRVIISPASVEPNMLMSVWSSIRSRLPSDCVCVCKLSHCFSTAKSHLESGQSRGAYPSMHSVRRSKGWIPRKAHNSRRDKLERSTSHILNKYTIFVSRRNLERNIWFSPSVSHNPLGSAQVSAGEFRRCGQNQKNGTVLLKEEKFELNCNSCLDFSCKNGG